MYSWFYRAHSFFTIVLQMELKSKIDGNALIGLLHSVPESVSSSDLGIWLKDDVLPCMLCHFSEQMVSFTSWLTDRIQRLELTEQVSAHML